MLSLSLFRGHGLLVFVLPTYKPAKHKRRPLCCPPVNRDLRADAVALLASGHAIAAAMTARVEIERLLTTLAMRQSGHGAYWMGVRDTAEWLRRRHLIRLRTLNSVLTANDTGNAAAHSKEVTSEAVEQQARV